MRTGSGRLWALNKSGGGYGGQRLLADSGNNRLLEYSPARAVPPPGDVNGDGNVTVADATLALRAAVGSLTLAPDQVAAADVNHDGHVDIGDVTLILRFALGLITQFPKAM